MGSRLIAAVAVATLALTTASAQTPSDSKGPGAGVGTVTSQSSDQWLASKLIGTNVYNDASEKIGSVSDILLDKKGMPIAAVIGVGGFLGIGEKKVAVDLKSLDLMRSADGDKVVAHMNKDQLLAAADFKPYTPPAPQAPATANKGPLGAPPAGRSPGSPQ